MPRLDPVAPPPRANPPRIQGIAIVSDAWFPQVNGVVRTLAAAAAELRATGRTVEVIGPDRFRTIPCPTYPDIRLAVMPGQRLARMIEAFGPDALHIATEGPLGIAARCWALRSGFPFTRRSTPGLRSMFGRGLGFRFARFTPGFAASMRREVA